MKTNTLRHHLLEKFDTLGEVTQRLFFLQMPEEEAFCVFVKLMQDYRLRELFKPSMAELGLCMYQFEYMIQVDTSYFVVGLRDDDNWAAQW